MRKHLLLLAVVTVAFVIALAPGVAMANFSIHGGYSMDTDACAGCHRAHTAASSITWTKSDTTEGSALLNSTATEIYQFCYTCHDAVSLGAETNVETGIYEGTLYGTELDPLNGGGFDGDIFTGTHMYTGSSWMVYGGSTAPDILGQLKDGPQVTMSCSSCHDVHGSSNYRLLKDYLPALERDWLVASGGARVGGYDETSPGTFTPTPWVISTESGYPTGGWLLHEAGAVQVAGYTPSYTEPKYAKAPGLDTAKGMTGWCAGCHIQYNLPTGAWVNTPTVTPSALTSDAALGYDSNDGWGSRHFDASGTLVPTVRHRHPVNVPLSNYLGARALIVTDQVLPLAHEAADAATNDDTDWIDCLTCHVAHGSSVVMTGYADIADSTDPQPNSGTGGIPPTGDNALLRLDSRGVCENCHNK